MQKTLRILFIIFLLIGVIFGGVAAGCRFYAIQDSAGMVEVTGTIISQDREGYPTVAYDWEGFTYSKHFNARSSSERIGDAYPLMIDPADPVHVLNPALNILTLVFGIIGGTFIAVALILMGISSRSRRRYEDLLARGQRVSVTVTDVTDNPYIAVNNRHPVNLHAECRNPITGQTMQLKSQNLFDRALYPGMQVDVLFDPNDPEKYIFDVAEDRT